MIVLCIVVQNGIAITVTIARSRGTDYKLHVIESHDTDVIL